jgi:hypothetical protein
MCFLLPSTMTHVIMLSNPAPPHSNIQPNRRLHNIRATTIGSHATSCACQALNITTASSKLATILYYRILFASLAKRITSVTSYQIFMSCFLQIAHAIESLPLSNMMPYSTTYSEVPATTETARFVSRSHKGATDRKRRGQNRKIGYIVT